VTTRRRPVGNVTLAKLKDIQERAATSARLADKALRERNNPDLLEAITSKIARQQEAIQRLVWEIREGGDQI
jgi:hypothetical protein